MKISDLIQQAAERSDELARDEGQENRHEWGQLANELRTMRDKVQRQEGRQGRAPQVCVER